MRVGQARKRDAVEAEIVQGLRAVGIQVWRLSEPGLPDLLAYQASRQRFALLEVKAKTGRLTAAQDEYTGPRYVVRTVEEALAVFGMAAAGYAMECGRSADGGFDQVR